MSRVGKNPVVLPAGVEVSIAEQIVVKGPLGTLKIAANPAVNVSLEGQNLTVTPNSAVENASAMWGTMRANLNNMVVGVSKGFERKLQLVGVGYRAQAQGDVLNLSLGFSHPVAHKMPAGVKVECPTQTEILIKGSDKQMSVRSLPKFAHIASQSLIRARVYATPTKWWLSRKPRRSKGGICLTRKKHVCVVPAKPGPRSPSLRLCVCASIVRIATFTPRLFPLAVERFWLRHLRLIHQCVRKFPMVAIRLLLR